MKTGLLATCLLLVFASCKKDVKELPPATQTGEHTFGAKVNGEFWVPRRFGPIPASNILRARFVGDHIYINAMDLSSSPNETEFEIFLKDVIAPGVYQLNTTLGAPSTTANYAYFVKRNLSPQNEWMTSASYTGTVTITRIDRTARIISGLFEFNMLNLYNAPQPMAVTEGRFDIKVP